MKLVHYNSAYLEEDVLSQLVSHTCSLATQPSSPAETGVRNSSLYCSHSCSFHLQLCLSFLDAVICYAVFPPETVLCSITTLCHTLNIERFIQRSLEVGVACWCGRGFTALYTGDAAIVGDTSRTHRHLHHVQCPTGQVRSLSCFRT